MTATDHIPEPFKIFLHTRRIHTCMADLLSMRNLALKLSQFPFPQGEPGSM